MRRIFSGRRQMLLGQKQMSSGVPEFSHQSKVCPERPPAFLRAQPPESRDALLPLFSHLPEESRFHGVHLRRDQEFILRHLCEHQVAPRSCGHPAMKRLNHRPRCIVIAGPNGAGKTTFAREYLPKVAGVIQFVNADLIAQGLSPLEPQFAALAAGRLLLQRVSALAATRADFAFESTLSGLTYARQLRSWKADGYRIEIVYLRLRSPQLALRRIAARVRQGGHNVPRADVLRRFTRGWENFERLYRPLADEWTIYDNSGRSAKLSERWP
jgi:predicted ABC-type ATPase